MASKAEPQGLYAKATRAELSQSYDDAFRLYIRAAEGFLQNSRTQTEPEKSKSKKDAGKALERAERIKNVKGAGGSGTGSLRPVGVDIWSAEEQDRVLEKSSLMNGKRVPLWNGPDAGNDLPSSQPELSPDQIARGATWRVLEPVDDQYISEGVNPEGVIQHVVSDCSVCAAMSICIALQERRNTLTTLSGCRLERTSKRSPDQIYLSSSVSFDRHDLRVFFNGTWRRIRIDSALPIDSSGTILGLSAYSAITRTPIQWPSLVEKAYMKLMGGYDFPGSNSSIDFHALSGWVPEHIEIRSPAFAREKTWTKIVAGHMNGHCVLTLGTDHRASSPTIKDWALKRWGRELIGEHNYAVVDVKERDGEKHMTILDSRIDMGLLINEVHRNQVNNLSSTFDMAWDDICSVFEGVYLNWDPALFKNCLQFHGIWKGKNVQDTDMASHRHLRLKIISSTNAHSEDKDIWVLLSRHLSDSSHRSEYIALHVHDEDEHRSDIHSIAEKATFTSSVHVLVRTRILAGTKALSILASYDGSFDEVGFTLSVYTSANVLWDQTISQPPFMHKETGSLTSKNAGGNCSYPTFMINPQYHLQIYPDAEINAGVSSGSRAKVTLTCEMSRQTPINIAVVWSQGERVMELTQREVAASSGPYGYGFVRADQELQVGDFTVIMSAFDPDHMGPFTLRVQSSHRFDLRPIPQEGAGMYHKVIRGAWDEQSAVGGAMFKRYLSNPIYEIDLQSATLLRIRLQLFQPSHAASINVTLFQTSPNSEAIGKHLATSGPYSDAISGVVTPEISLNPGKYLLIPSTYQPAVLTAFRMILYCSTATVTFKLRPSRDI